MTERPAGITALVVLACALSLAAWAYAGCIAAGQISLSAGAWVLLGGLEQMGPVAFVLYAVLLLLLAYGLWSRRAWARRVALLVAVAGIALTVPAMSSAVVDSRAFAIAREGAQIIVRVLIVFYLSQQPVKEWFSRS